MNDKHFSFSLSIQIISVIRNPRDVCLSYLNHMVLTENYTGDLSLLVDIFIRDLGPYYAPYFKHVLSYWEERQRKSNMLIIFYEDLKKDIKSMIKKIADFVEIEVSEEDVERLSEHTSIDKMRVNPMTNLEDGIKVIMLFLFFSPPVLY